MDCVLSDIKNAKLGTGRSIQGIEGYGGGPLWRRRAAFGCSANGDEEERKKIINHLPIVKRNLGTLIDSRSTNP